jgi:hypothetical protein
MSKEFNYKRAWEEYVKPEFEKLYNEVHKVLNATRVEVDNISQVDATKTVTGHSKELMAMFDAIPTEVLAWASEVVYYYGHLASGKQCQGGELYWKFQDLASMSLINRKPYDSEIIHKAKVKMDKALEGFHDHEESTEYSNEEVPEYIRGISASIEEGIVEMHAVHNVNHKPDMFCIGQRHFPKDGGMYIQPEQAPCYTCGQPYSEHTSDRVMLLKPIVKDDKDPDTFLKDNQEAIKKIMLHINEICTAAKIKLDGFAFIKP